MEREVKPSIARNPIAKSKSELRRALLETRVEAAREPVLNDALKRRVHDLLNDRAPVSVGFYWPLSGEFDARDAIASWLAADSARIASLPVIVQRGAPLEFHAWTPDMPMRDGEHRIPEPTSARIVIPDLLLVPCVGFDADGYRLGYGGGYYDRTLAAWPGAQRPVTVGIAYEACRTDALTREAHDIPLDAIVTDSAIYPQAQS
ncbi:5-formyltetrahydrofolate cyclo-ligase [Paraburkholderia flava]|uniref:5-formyltetrahydrofolate cyclo-ligase n=1 Tax=Paraburkholderia flava TaxID=2547393 RepID=UPI00105E0B5A|nr:5-formyltetrahydrofolate cyclo-ligase [Paraburkholderia flava]